MKKVIVIGGGLAGITAAVYLKEKNYEVTLIESSPALGGRTKSFFDSGFNCYLDNGQHILIKGYKNTLELLKKFRAGGNFFYKENFSITFLDKKSNEWQFSISKSVKTVIDFLRLKNLNLSEKISLLKFFMSIKNLKHESLENETALELLERNKQSKNLINNFWKLLIESALNTPIEKTSGQIFLFVLEKMFIEDITNSSLIIPKYSFHESLIVPAEKYLQEKKIKILKACGIEKILIENNMIKGALDKYGNVHFADYYVLAVHPANIQKLINEYKFQLEYQTIINLHIKLSSKKYENKFFAIWDSIIHWVFFHKNHLTVVKSSADNLLKFSNKEIVEIFLNELVLIFPDLSEKLIQIKNDPNNFRLIKEKRATFISELNSLKNRPLISTKFNNLFLAGDYVNTGYPSTIESAVISGRMVADEIDRLSNT